jgi:hypothetical protein
LPANFSVKEPHWVAQAKNIPSLPSLFDITGVLVVILPVKLIRQGVFWFKTAQDSGAFV